MAEKVFSFEEVAKHNKNGDCWLIIYGKVYNVSPFLEEHPGGDDVMLTATGKDASSDFEDVGHSSFAEEKMKEFFIGNIDESPPPKMIANPTASSMSKENDSSSKFLLYFLPLLILGVAFLLRYYSKNEDA